MITHAFAWIRFSRRREKRNVLGVERIRSEHRGAALASPATLNARLEAMLEPAMASTRARHILCASTTREFAELRYRTLDSWSRERRVIGKAEAGARGDNPRFIVTNIGSQGLRGWSRESAIQSCWDERTRPMRRC